MFPPKPLRVSTFSAFSKGKKLTSKLKKKHLNMNINFQPAGFLAFKEKSGPLLQPYVNC